MVSSANDTKVTIGAFEAKTHFSKLLERAHAGEEIVITHRGEPYARLVPLKKENQPKESRAEIFARIRQRAKQMGINATSEEIIAWKHEGHRY